MILQTKNIDLAIYKALTCSIVYYLRTFFVGLISISNLEGLIRETRIARFGILSLTLAFCIFVMMIPLVTNIIAMIAVISLCTYFYAIEKKLSIFF